MYGKNVSKLTITSEKVKDPVSVRYGWKNYLKGNLYNTQGLPASSFRSDTSPRNSTSILVLDACLPSGRSK